ncbi:MAG: potassium transporter TrkA [Halalkalicoccus sp.]
MSALLVPAIEIALRTVALAALAGAVTAAVAAGYRLYAREAMPARLGVLVGLSAVAIWLNTLVALTQYVAAGTDPLALPVALPNALSFLAGALAADAGRRAGDRLAANSSVLAGATAVDGELSPLVGAVGRVITVTLPATIEDVPGYEPVPEETKASLEGATLVFPRGLTVVELRERLETRLADDYEVGHVDCEIGADGTVLDLAVGLRASGLGPTLASGTAAVAVRADPAPDARPGDTVQLWRDRSRVTTGELRDATGETATIAIDRADSPLDAAEHRLVTLAESTGAQRGARALFRSAASERSVDAQLAGTRVAEYEGIVLGVEREDGRFEALPAPDRRLETDERIFALDQAATA